MEGCYKVEIKTGKLLYEFTLKRKITKLCGPSATGKSTLARLVSLSHTSKKVMRLMRNGDLAPSDVAIRTVTSDNLDILLSNSVSNSIMIIDTDDIDTDDIYFRENFTGSDNYFIIITRKPMTYFPYSVNEVYCICEDNYRNSIVKAYSFKHYRYFEKNKINISPDTVVITEDSNSGNEFFAVLFKNHVVVSANGKSNFINKIKELINKGINDIVIIADGAAFGSEIEALINFTGSIGGINVMICLPESFEHMLLSIVPRLYDKEFSEHPFDFCGNENNGSWETLFTSRLTKITQNTPYQYGKHRLNEIYLGYTEEAKEFLNITDNFDVSNILR